MAMISVLLDTNIILDVIARREPFYAQSAVAWSAVESGIIHGMIAAHSVTTLYYLLSRQLTRQSAVQAISDLLRVFSIAPIDSKVIQDALALAWHDFEDAVQATAALQAGAHYLVTRNTQDYPLSPIRIISPKDLSAILHSPGLA